MWLAFMCFGIQKARYSYLNNLQVLNGSEDELSDVLTGFDNLLFYIYSSY